MILRIQDSWTCRVLRTYDARLGMGSRRLVVEAVWVHQPRGLMDPEPRVRHHVLPRCVIRLWPCIEL